MSNVVNEWINHARTEVLEWPSQSLWGRPLQGIVKRKMRDTRPNNTDELGCYPSNAALFEFTYGKKEHFYYIKNKIRSPTLFLCWSRSFRYENVYKCFLKFTFRLLLFKWIIDDLPFDFISVVAAVIVDGGEWFLVPVGHVHFP